MDELVIRFPRDEDGALAKLELSVDDEDRFLDRPLELRLLFQDDDPARDPVLVLWDLEGARRTFTSQPLPGELFLELRGIWESRRAEGFQVILHSPGRAEPRVLELFRLGLDFAGHLARARLHEARGELEKALECYRKSSAPGAEEAAARLQARRGGKPEPSPSWAGWRPAAQSASGKVPAPEEAAPPAPREGAESSEEGRARLDDRIAVLEILRALAADGKVDAQEARTFQALGKIFPVDAATLKRMVAQVRQEGRPTEAKPMVPEEVLRGLIRRAADQGKIGAGSSQVLNRAAKVLGMSKDRILQVLNKKA